MTSSGLDRRVHRGLADDGGDARGAALALGVVRGIVEQYPPGSSPSSQSSHPMLQEFTAIVWQRAPLLCGRGVEPAKNPIVRCPRHLEDNRQTTGAGFVPSHNGAESITSLPGRSTGQVSVAYKAPPALELPFLPFSFFFLRLQTDQLRLDF